MNTATQKREIIRFFLEKKENWKEDFIFWLLFEKHIQFKHLDYEEIFEVLSQSSPFLNKKLEPYMMQIDGADPLGSMLYSEAIALETPMGKSVENYGKKLTDLAILLLCLYYDTSPTYEIGKAVEDASFILELSKSNRGLQAFYKKDLSRDSEISTVMETFALSCALLGDETNNLHSKFFEFVEKHKLYDSQKEDVIDAIVNTLAYWIFRGNSEK